MEMKNAKKHTEELNYLNSKNCTATAGKLQFAKI